MSLLVRMMQPSAEMTRLIKPTPVATGVAFTYRDNRGTMHRALPYAPTSNRTMHRTTLVGDEAIA